MNEPEYIKALKNDLKFEKYNCNFVSINDIEMMAAENGKYFNLIQLIAKVL